MLGSFTLEQLIELRDEVADAWRRSLRAVSYGISTRQLARAQPQQLFEQLQRIEAELAARQGSAVIQGAFPDTSAPLHEDAAS